MYVFAIIASFQGVVDGVVFANTDIVEVEAKLDRLVREEVARLRGEGTKWWSLDDVRAEYDLAIQNCAKVTEYVMDEFEVEEN